MGIDCVCVYYLIIYLVIHIHAEITYQSPHLVKDAFKPIKIKVFTYKKKQQKKFSAKFNF